MPGYILADSFPSNSSAQSPATPPVKRVVPPTPMPTPLSVSCAGILSNLPATGAYQTSAPTKIPTPAPAPALTDKTNTHSRIFSLYARYLAALRGTPATSQASGVESAWLKLSLECKEREA
ncbi:hypothetical protein CC80DRAFT_51589 [Byssothecium circinans]|uniref:Uncharacterized protein n=1 Tax=Byssothecium circinans TaxID=147558 RepID=A0A6A5U1Q8_9PLEO|nr:hypothetical protein CC80DRAFT_51589 [Byssothecium circinans]